MSNYFDKVRTIVLDKGTKKSKIERLQKECNCTAYQAETFYNSLFSELSIVRAKNLRDAVLRFTIGVEIECYGLDSDELRYEVYNTIGYSRFAFLGDDSRIRCFGHFYEFGGCMYSNANFM